MNMLTTELRAALTVFAARNQPDPQTTQDCVETGSCKKTISALVKAMQLVRGDNQAESEISRTKGRMPLGFKELLECLT